VKHQNIEATLRHDQGEASKHQGSTLGTPKVKHQNIEAALRHDQGEASKQ